MKTLFVIAAVVWSVPALAQGKSQDCLALAKAIDVSGVQTYNPSAPPGSFQAARKVVEGKIAEYLTCVAAEKDPARLKDPEFVKKIRAASVEITSAIRDAAFASPFYKTNIGQTFRCMTYSTEMDLVRV